jgi:hypothetical protein
MLKFEAHVPVIREKSAKQRRIRLIGLSYLTDISTSRTTIDLKFRLVCRSSRCFVNLTLARCELQKTPCVEPEGVNGFDFRR